MERGNWTKVPNEVFDFVMQDLTGAEVKVFLTLIRLTSGFHKKTDRATYDQLQERTGLARDSVWRALGSLQSKDLILENSRGYYINYAQIVRKSDSTASNIEIVRKSDSTVRKSDSNSPKIGLQSPPQNVRKSDSQKTKEIFKETPPPVKKEPPAGWEPAVEALVVVGIENPLAVELCEIAAGRGRDKRYILDITGYVALSSTGAKNPAAMAIALIRGNQSRNIEPAPDAPGRSSRPENGQKGNIDWDAPKYQHGGSSHFLVKSDCPICRKERES